MLAKDGLDELVAGGMADARERFGDAFIEAAEKREWVEGERVVIPPSACEARIVTADRTIVV